MIPHSKVILSYITDSNENIYLWTEKGTQCKNEQEPSERDKSVIVKFFINYSHTT